MGHCSLAPVASSQKRRQRAETLPSEKEPGPLHSIDSLSPDDVHSEAKCILHSVGLALWGRDARAQQRPRPVQDARWPCQACPLYSQGGGAARPLLSFTFANLMASLSLSRALWKYATCGGQQVEPGQSCLDSPATPLSPAWPLGDPLEGKKLRREVGASQANKHC